MSSEAADLKATAFVIDKPENIEQAVRDEDQLGKIVGSSSETLYPVDIVIENSGAQSAIVTEIVVEVTQVWKPDYCGLKEGGGGGLRVSAHYDFPLDYLSDVSPEHPVIMTKSTRLEIPAHESTRLGLTMAQQDVGVNTPIYIYMFNVYLRAAGNDEQIFVGTGKAVNSTDIADGLIEDIPRLAENQANCMRHNAAEASRITSAKGANSPKVNELNDALKEYR